MICTLCQTNPIYVQYIDIIIHIASYLERLQTLYRFYPIQSSAKTLRLAVRIGLPILDLLPSPKANVGNLSRLSILPTSPLRPIGSRMIPKPIAPPLLSRAPSRWSPDDPPPRIPPVPSPPTILGVAHPLDFTVQDSIEPSEFSLSPSSPSAPTCLSSNWSVATPSSSTRSYAPPKDDSLERRKLGNTKGENSLRFRGWEWGLRISLR